MSSGVKVSKSVTDEFEAMKMKQKYRYILFKLNDKLTEIVVDETGDREAKYEEFKNKLLEVGAQRQCRYGVFDLDFEFNGKPKNKLVFFAWAPENAIIKQKMVYTSSKDYLKKALQLVPEVQATDADELTLESATEKAQRGMKD